MDANVGLLLMVVLNGIGTLFVFCYYGRIATDSYLEMGDCLYECDWRILSIDLQKYFILMIGNTQKPIFYNSFGFAILNMNTFCKVIALKKPIKEYKCLSNRKNINQFLYFSY